ncbi:MAG: hypothetical protein JXA54_16680 [Candidatus Heimdallarchaeota archaeon]|nr:hypothetical protein [Candidatus Heimdallarchaeota archaeon]
MKKSKIVGICFIILTSIVLFSSVKNGNAIYIPPPIHDPGNGGTPHDTPVISSISLESITFQNTFELRLYVFSPMPQMLIKIIIINSLK